MDVEAVGVVPDEVLLLCGRPASAPSAWWTPSLVGLPSGETDRRLAAACGVLEDAGVRDPSTGRLAGLLGGVADIVATARLLLLLETAVGGPAVQRSVVARSDRALLDLQAPHAGLHDLVLAGPAATAVLLCGLLADGMTPTPSPAVRGLAGARTAADVATALSPTGHRSTTRIVRASRGEAAAHLVTVVHHDEGSVACWASQRGDVLVDVLDGDGAVVDLALALLGAAGSGVAG